MQIAPFVGSVDVPILQGGPAVMLRQSLTILSIATIVSCFTVSQSAKANDWDEFWARYHIDVQRNQAWPQPFLRAEQVRARAPFAAMVAEGWREQNTLTSDHFEPETQTLNQAGLYKVKSILRNSPVAHSSIFVHAAFDPKLNQTRLTQVQSAVSQWVPEDATPAIVMTTRKPYGVPGNYADMVNRRFVESLPTPALPVAVGQGTGAGGGAGGGGGGGGGGGRN